MEIRHITPADDFDAISRIYALSWKTAYSGIVPADYLADLSETQWSDFLKDSDSLVVIENGVYIGTSCICSAREASMKGWGEIVSIYMLPDYWGKGYAKPLFEAAVSALDTQGFQHVYLWVLVENSRARTFYEKNGFFPTADRQQLSVSGKELTEVRYANSAQ